MSIVTVQTHIKGLLDGLVLPGPAGVPPLEAFITPPDPNEETARPAVYVWPTSGHESRRSMPRNTGPNTPAAWKDFRPSIDVYLVWFDDNTDPYVDSAFPSVIDAVLRALRTSPDPVKAVDPNTGEVSWLLGVGEDMSWSNFGVTAVLDQRWTRYDALVIVPFLESIQA